VLTKVSTSGGRPVGTTFFWNRFITKYKI